MSCNGCGGCCDPVTVDLPGSLSNAWKLDAGDLKWAMELRPTATEGEYTCPRYDPVMRQCTDYDNRPPVCRDYPLYDRDSMDVRYLDGCGYISEVIVAVGG